MSKTLHIGIVPAVKLDAIRKETWNKICQHQLDELKDNYEWENAILIKNDEQLRKLQIYNQEYNEDKNKIEQIMKDEFKEEYAMAVSGSYCDVRRLDILGVPYLISGSYTYGDPPLSAVCFMKIESLFLLYDWLENEALKESGKAESLASKRSLWESLFNSGES